MNCSTSAPQAHPHPHPHPRSSETVIVVIDDAQRVLQELATLPPLPPSGHGAVAADEPAPHHWVLLACPPRMSQRIGKFMSQSARQGWQNRWSEKLRAQLAPTIQEQCGTFELHIAGSSFPAQLLALRTAHPGAVVRDLRQPRSQPATGPAPSAARKGFGRGALPGSLLMLLCVLSITPD